MGALLSPDELPRWVPGVTTLDSAELGWPAIRLRGWRYGPSDVPAPGLHDYMLVVYTHGATDIHRRCGGQWQSGHVHPGVVSLMTRAVSSHWRWGDTIEVSHVYLSPAEVVATASDVFQRDIDHVELFDALRVEDCVLPGVAAALAREASEGGLGGGLYVDALRRQACIHILRNYADVGFREPACHGGLSRAQSKAIVQYIEDNIGQPIGLSELAGLAQLSVSHFVRKFGTEFGFPPHVYVVRRRVERAKALLARRGIPLKVVAADSGFSDQSHMTRLFRKLLDTTPAEYRRRLAQG